METITYREVELGDAEALISFMKTVLAETPYLRIQPEEFSLNVKQEEDYISNFILNRSLIMMLAMANNEIVGVGSIEGNQLKKFNHNGEFGIVVKKAYWNKGIARDISASLLSWAKKNPKLKKINLHVCSENSIAVDFYKKLGFQKEGCLKNDIYYNGTYHDTLLMGMNVD